MARPVRWEGWRRSAGAIRPSAALSLPNVSGNWRRLLRSIRGSAKSRKRSTIDAPCPFTITPPHITPPLNPTHSSTSLSLRRDCPANPSNRALTCGHKEHQKNRCHGPTVVPVAPSRAFLILCLGNQRSRQRSPERDSGVFAQPRWPSRDALSRYESERDCPGVRTGSW